MNCAIEPQKIGVTSYTFIDAFFLSALAKRNFYVCDPLRWGHLFNRGFYIAIASFLYA